MTSVRVSKSMRPPRMRTRVRDPIVLFERWFADTLATREPWANAMTLATATPNGSPSARAVLLKSVDSRGFVFFTDYRSRKARELDKNRRAALVLIWPTQRRQVRIIGRVHRTPVEESDAYFRGRPQGSKIAAWASHQGRVLQSRGQLVRRWQSLSRRFRGNPVPRPPHWGGYRLVPTEIEFWEERAYRLHDRLRYRRLPGGRWRRERLSP